MKRALAFMRRNIKEMVRDPLIYIFCICFPAVMLVLFTVIDSQSGGHTPIFAAKSLIPGILVFSYTFVMLLMSLLISKDRKTSLLKRLYISPLKTRDFIFGYAFPAFLTGIVQSVFCVLLGYLLSLITKNSYFTFLESLLLIVSELPILLFFVFMGIFIGSLFNDKSAPGVTSVLISLGGILGGCWMPLDTMDGFETFCRFLPFYPAVYIGRIITKASHTPLDDSVPPSLYAFDDVARYGLITIALYLLLSVILAFVFFQRQKRSEK